MCEISYIEATVPAPLPELEFLSGKGLDVGHVISNMWWVCINLTFNDFHNIGIIRSLKNPQREQLEVSDMVDIYID